MSELFTSCERVDYLTPGLHKVSDEQLLTFFKKCKSALRSADSVIVVKENVTHPSKEREYDEQDKSWTRYAHPSVTSWQYSDMDI